MRRAARQAVAPRSASSNLDRDDDKPLADAVSAGASCGIAAADEALVDLDSARERFAFGGSSRSTSRSADGRGRSRHCPRR
jgi:hypothetical protein